MSQSLHQDKRRAQCAALLLLFAATLLGGVRAASSQICNDARLLQTISEALFAPKQRYYSEILLAYGANSQQAQQAAGFVAAATRVEQNCPYGACNVEDVKLVLYEAYTLATIVDSSTGRRLYPELVPLYADSYALFVRIQTGATCLLRPNLPPPNPNPADDSPKGECGPVFGYTGPIRNLRRGQGNPNDGLVWFRDHSLRWFRYDNGIPEYWDVGRPDGRDGPCEKGAGL